MIDQIWANAAIESCLRHGIDHFFLAPGSRCTPLTLAVARNERAHVVQHFDERGLAFAALGYARATGRPGVFICTSGTAVANAFPAVIEASMEGVPMLLFTADRPMELRGTGANQTIDQLEIFGSYAKAFLNLRVPPSDGSAGNPQDAHFPMPVLEQAFEAAKHGPAHLNWMFHEPFTIDAQNSDRSQGSLAEPGTREVASSFSIDSLKIEVGGNVLIALGSCRPEEASEALELSRRLNCPTLCDVTSGLRAGSFELPSEFALPVPDTILHLGGRIVSKTWHQWTASLADKGVEFIHLTPTGQTVNPNGLDVTKIQLPLENLSSKVVGSGGEDSFRQSWTDAAAIRDQLLQDQLADVSGVSQLSEPAIAFHLSRRCPLDHGLFIGNSMPIRDMDWFGVAATNLPRSIAANRGASGIDGLLATAVGYANGLRMPTTVLLGDLSALHDLNSLALIAKSKWPLTVVIVNNQAGHIFDQLPIRESEHFEQFFATPHDCRFEHAAKMFGLEYRQITDMADFVQSYGDACSSHGSIVLELMTNRELNGQVRKQIREKIKTCSDQF